MTSPAYLPCLHVELPLDAAYSALLRLNREGVQTRLAPGSGPTRVLTVCGDVDEAWLLDRLRRLSGAAAVVRTRPHH
ncbi:MAG: hypothetical protein CMH83_03800 [Nocardioides sp.]|nr:hypothetical protein [Nocardioides sp.]